MNSYAGFKPQNEYLICIDSDGCVMDTMNIKHVRCFGPCLIEEWQLERCSEKVLSLWNQINLYSMTRGINRFRGLAYALEMVDQNYIAISDLSTLTKWTQESLELSEESLLKQIEQTNSICLQKALSWSQKVNSKIHALPKSQIRSFRGAKETILELHNNFDLVVVSSANREAINEEWSKMGLAESVDLILDQTAGSKANCISGLLAFGYKKEQVLMVGDAPGDLQAARENGVFYYPILTGREEQCWEELIEVAKRFRDGTYGGEYEMKKQKQFMQNLNE